jgi:hypothetical protein
MAPQKMPKGELSWEDWQKKANAEYVKGQRGAQEMIKDWGYPKGMSSDTHKIEFDKGKVKRKDRLVRKSTRAKATTQRVKALKAQTVGEDVYGKGVVAPKGSNLEEHHKRVVSVYQPFFEGLGDKETEELAQWFVDEGYGLGNVKENLSAANKVQHEAIHTWMRENIVEPTGKPLLNFKGYTLNERLPAAVLYLENVQAAVDEQLKKTLMPSGSALKTLGKAASVLPGVGAVLDVGDVLAGTQQAVTSNSKQQQTTGALRSASGTLGLASLAAPVLAPAALAVSGVSALAERRAAMPKPAQVNQIIPTPKPVMANTPTGVAQLKAMPKSKPLNLVNEAQYFIVNPIRSAYDRIFGKRDI